MHRLLQRVEKELETIADKGLTSGNLDTTYKLIDIYKDIKESEYYEKKSEEGSYDAVRSRDARGRFRDSDKWRLYDIDERRDDWDSERYGLYPREERTSRHLERMRDGLNRYMVGKERYKDGDSGEKMLDGIEMTMGAICTMVEYLYDNAETSKEKEVIRKHIEKMKNM